MGDQEIQAKLGIPIVQKKEGSFELVGLFNSVQKRKGNIDQEYESRIDRMASMLNHDRTVFTAQAMDVGPDGQHELGGTRPLRLLQTAFDNVMPSIQVFSDIDYDRRKLSQSSQQRDRLKNRAIERIDSEFADALREAENSGDETKVSQVKHKKNLAWSVIKEDIDASDWKKIRPKQIQSAVDQVLSMSNNFSTMEDHNVFREVNTTFRGNPQVQMEKFQEFKQGNKFFTYDIETIGDALNSDQFSVSEIAIQGFEKNSEGKFVQSDDRFTRLVRMRAEEVGTMTKIIDGLAKDGQTFNALQEWEKRTVLDLMRYSTNGEIKADLLNLVHNGVIQDIFDEREKIKTSYVVNNMNELLPHMRSGLSNLQDQRYTFSADSVVNDFNRYVNERGGHYFVGHNSDNFDNPKLKSWASSMGQNLTLPTKSMDFMSVVQTMYPNAHHLHEELRTLYGTPELPYLKGMTTLGELQRSLGLDMVNKHSALADIGEDGLGGVLTKTMNTISNHIESSQVDIDPGLRTTSTDFSWSNEPIRTGQKLFSAGGFQAYQDGEMSFAARFDDATGEFVPTSSGYNNTVVNSKAFYQVNGIRDLSQDGQKIMALQLYNEMDDKYAFVVREGENAVDDLASFIQKRFYNWDGLGKGQQEEIYNNHLKDLSRRRYDRMFQLEKAGGGKTGGFEAAKRMYGTNAEVLAERIGGRSYNILEQAIETAKLENRDVNDVYFELKGTRITHDEMIQKMDFDSLWDPDRSGWKFNDSEMKEFFEMRQRLLSEKDHFVPALEKIEKHYEKDLQAAIDSKNRSQEFEIKKRRDMSWMIYSNRIKEQIGKENLPFDEVIPDQFENSIVHVNDGDNTPRQLNLHNYQTARRSINSYAYAGLNDLPQDEKNKRARERLVRMVKNLADQEIINQKAKNTMFDLVTSNLETGNASNQIADYLLNDAGRINFEKVRMQTGLGFNNGISTIDPNLNGALVRDAISQVDDMMAVKLNNSTQAGAKIRFGDAVNDVLNELDGKERLSGLRANNRLAVENVLSNLLNNDQFKGLHYAVSVDKDNANLKITAYKPDSSTSVVPRLARGEHVDNALNIVMPMINENGTHVIGNRVLNARTIADYTDGKVVMKSTAEVIADDYSTVLSRALRKFHDGDTEGAQSVIRRQLNRSVSNLSGIQRSISSGDQDFWNNNMNDFVKQSQIEVESAMIKSLYNQPGGVKRGDFSNPNDVFDKSGGFKRRVGFSDLYPEASYGLALKMGDWVDDNNIEAFTSSVKADHVSAGRVASVDIRELIPYGDYIFQGRDNSIQFMNAHLLEPEVIQRMKDSGRYVNFNPSVTTDKQKAFRDEWMNQTDGGVRINEGKAIGADVKTVYMNDADVLNRLEDMKKSHRELLLREGILNADDSWNKVRMPRIYENQGLVVNDFADSVSVNEQKVLQDVAARDKFTERLNNKVPIPISPGDVIGYKNGAEVRWESPHEGFLHMQNDELMMKWQESPFKWSLNGEKATDFRISAEMMEAITGSSDATFIFNPDVIKHKDFGMVMAGKANLIGQYMREQHDRLDQANADKTSALGQSRKAIQKHIDEVAESAKTIGLEWNAEDRTFLERTREMDNRKIAMSSFDTVMEKWGINHTTRAGGKDFEVGILTAHANKVSNYSKVVDHTGMRVIDIKDNGDRVYAESGRSGVKWGHRELAVLNDLGLGSTYDATLKQIMDQAQDKDAYALNKPGFNAKSVNRLQETHNIMTALASLKDENYVHAANSGTLTLDAFADLPEIERDNHTLMNTVFDKEHVLDRLGKSQHDNVHGYWLELPSSEENGVQRSVGINLEGDTQTQKNKIFIPFTNVEGADGQVQFRELQRNIADIYERAKAVDESKDSRARSSAMDQLQTSVNNYTDRLVRDISSSKGQTGSSVLKAVMPNSATGLFKLMDPNTSRDLNGEFTYISEVDAKGLNIYDNLKRGDDLYTMNVRYPTFHKNAMQISKIRMDSSIRPGEFHTTSLMSSFMKADSDGDYDNIVVMKDEQVQKEWARKYEKSMQERDLQYAKHIEKDYSPDRQFDANSISADPLEPNRINSQDEIAAKIGKRIIGSASNLNYSMSQMARDYLSDNYEQREAMLKFGQSIEQKLISSKHGGTVGGGAAPAIDFIRAVYDGDYNSALNLHNDFKAAGTEIVDEATFNKAFEGIDMIKRRSAEGLRTDMLKFGTSYGVSSRNGINSVIDMVLGNTPIDDSVNSNGFLNALRHAMGMEVQRPTITDPERPSVDPYQSIEPEARVPRDASFAGKVGDLAEDGLGGWQTAGDKARSLAHKVGSNPFTKWGTIGGALALGGLAGYNVLSHEEPLAPPPMEEPPSGGTARSPLPQLDYGNAQHNANISVSASGTSRQSSDQISHMVNQGMQQSGMNAGATRVTVNQQDNTQKLNRIWYRDRVEENI